MFRLKTLDLTVEAQIKFSYYVNKMKKVETIKYKIMQ